MLKMITTEVPVGLEQFYTPTDDGQFKLQVEGAADANEVASLKTKNKEFRDNNLNLIKENEKYKGFATLIGTDNLTPDKFQEKIDSLAEARVATITADMKVNYETRLKELNEVATKSSSKLGELVLGSAVTKAAAEHGVVTTALDDVVSRAKNAFDVVDGELTFKAGTLDAEGKPYTLASWMTEQRTKAPHLFAPSQGTGAQRITKGQLANSSQVKRTAVERLSSGLSQLNDSATKRIN